MHERAVNLLLQVCGDDGQTYENSCRLRCRHKDMAFRKGACNGQGNNNDDDDGNGCMCITLWAPVCGTDGKVGGGSGRACHPARGLQVAAGL